MKVDLLSRIKNKAFWIALIPAVLLLVQVCAVPFGYTIDLTVLSGQLIAIVNAVFAVLTILGVIADTSTSGFSDPRNGSDG